MTLSEVCIKINTGYTLDICMISTAGELGNGKSFRSNKIRNCKKIINRLDLF